MRKGGDGHLGRTGLAVGFEAHGKARAHRRRRNAGGPLRGAAHRPSTGFRDDRAHRHAGGGTRRSRLDAGHFDAPRDAHAHRFDARARQILDDQPRAAPAHRASRDELCHDGARHVDRDGEADPGGLPALGRTHGIDANELAANVDEGATRIAGIDGGVDLHEVLEGFVADARAHGRADDAERGGAFETVRVADGEDDIADTGAIRIAHGDFPQAVRLDLHDGDIRTGIRTDDAAGIAPPIRERHLDRFGIRNDVMIGQHEARRRIDHHAGTSGTGKRASGLGKGRCFAGCIGCGEFHGNQRLARDEHRHDGRDHLIQHRSKARNALQARHGGAHGACAILCGSLGRFRGATLPQTRSRCCADQHHRHGRGGTEAGKPSHRPGILRHDRVPSILFEKQSQTARRSGRTRQGGERRPPLPASMTSSLRHVDHGRRRAEVAHLVEELLLVEGRRAGDAARTQLVEERLGIDLLRVRVAFGAQVFEELLAVEAGRHAVAARTQLIEELLRVELRLSGSCGHHDEEAGRSHRCKLEKLCLAHGMLSTV